MIDNQYRYEHSFALRIGNEHLENNSPLGNVVILATSDVTEHVVRDSAIHDFTEMS